LDQKLRKRKDIEESFVMRSFLVMFRRNMIAIIKLNERRRAAVAVYVGEMRIVYKNI
jgi:hypothetical protein